MGVGPRKLATLLLVPLGLLASARTADACTCVIENRVLLASASNLAPADGPWLVTHGPGVLASLVDEVGNDVPIEVVRTYSRGSLCDNPFELVRPVAPLDSGARYDLALFATSGPPALDSRKFKATTREPRQVERVISVKVERVVDPGPIDSGSCAPAKLDGQTQTGHFTATLSSDSPALMFLSLSVTDSAFGELGDSTPTLGTGSATKFAVTGMAETSVPELETSAPCAHVVVRDTEDVTLFDEQMCPDPGASVTLERTVTLAEHLVREPPEQDDSGCNVSRSRSRLPALTLLALTLSLLLRRQRGAR
jgi:hypothetical protein